MLTRRGCLEPVRDLRPLPASSLQTSERRQVVRKRLGSAAAGEDHPVHSERGCRREEREVRVGGGITTAAPLFDSK